MPENAPIDRSAMAAAGAELRERLLDALRTEHSAAEKWLQEHHVALFHAIERICREHDASLRSEFEGIRVVPPPPQQEIRQPEAHEAPFNLEVTTVPEPPSACEEQEEEDVQVDANEVGQIKGGVSGLETKNAQTWWKARGFDKTSAAHSKFIATLTRDVSVMPKIPRNSVRGCLNAILQRTAFDLFIGTLIVLNTILMFVQLEVEAPDPLLTVQVDDDPALFFTLTGHVFNAIFFLELLTRIYVVRLSFFCSAFNWLDFAIVFTTSIDAYILSQISSNRQNISFMRMVRFVRVARALRVIRTMGLFRQLRVLLNTIAMSFMSLFWSMLILFIFMLMFSLFLCQMLQSFIIDPSEDQTMRSWVFRHYGTSFRALYTIFEVTFSGGWPNYARPLVEKVAATYAIFFIIYVTAVVFAMVRIISALFLKDTLQTAANDADMMVQERMKEMKAFVNKLSELFSQADESGDGNLSREEFKNIMSYPKVKVWMGVLGLDVSETTHLFDMLDNGDGLISYDEFVNGIMRMKGASRSQDTIAIMRDCQRICKHCAETQKACKDLQEYMVAHKYAPEALVFPISSHQHATAEGNCRDQEGSQKRDGNNFDVAQDRLQEL